MHLLRKAIRSYKKRNNKNEPKIRFNRWKNMINVNINTNDADINNNNKNIIIDSNQEILIDKEINKKQEIENYKTEKKILKNKLGLEDNKKIDNPDIEILSETLKKLNDMGIDIFVGSGLSEEDKNLVKNMLNLNDNDNENKKDGSENEYEGEDDIKEDLELGNQIVSLIEKDVNDLYLRKLIEQIKIDQINAITYVFQNEKETHEVTLKIVNEELYCSDNTTFSSWLIKHFSV